MADRAFLPRVPENVYIILRGADENVYIILHGRSETITSFVDLVGRAKDEGATHLNEE